MRYLCNYCEISRNGYYKHVNKEIKEELAKGLIVDIIQEERRLQPCIGGKKLYHIYKEIIHKIYPGCGRDKFLTYCENMIY